jgi:hypothetical protein
MSTLLCRCRSLVERQRAETSRSAVNRRQDNAQIIESLKLEILRKYRINIYYSLNLDYLAFKHGNKKQNAKQDRSTGKIMAFQKKI